MSVREKVILLGYSGHGFVVAETALKMGLKIVGYADFQRARVNPFNLEYLGNEEEESFSGWSNTYSFILGVGSNEVRANLAKKVNDKGKLCRLLIHPDSYISDYVEVGEGTFISRNVAINPFVKIGKNVILNTSTSVDHECVIKDNVHIAPGAVLAGSVKVNEGAFVGANSVVTEGLTIGKNAIIGAGSVVIRNVFENQKVVGNPARIISK